MQDMDLREEGQWKYSGVTRPANHCGDLTVCVYVYPIIIGDCALMQYRLWTAYSFEMLEH